MTHFRIRKIRWLRLWRFRVEWRRWCVELWWMEDCDGWRWKTLRPLVGIGPGWWGIWWRGRWRSWS